MAQKRAVHVAVGFEFRVNPIKWNLLPAPNSAWTLNGEDPGDLLIPTAEQGQVKIRHADAWEAREEFFRLQRGDTKKLLTFFNKWGQWVSDSTDEGVAAEEVWQICDRFRRAVRGPLTEWLTDQSVNASPLALFMPRAEYPHFFFATTSCALALHTTITLDLLRGIKFRPCAREDCPVVFSVDSDHKRKFCTQYCGHLVSLRKQRRKAKTAIRRKHAKG